MLNRTICLVIFMILTDTSVLIEQWRKEYNQVYPHSAKNYRPPAPKTTRSGPFPHFTASRCCGFNSSSQLHFSLLMLIKPIAFLGRVDFSGMVYKTVGSVDEADSRTKYGGE